MTREEAIDIIRKNIPHLGVGATEMTYALEELIPELRESEDERIRKALIQFLTEIKNISESGRDSWHVRKEDAGMCTGFLEYLEKQKPAWSEEDDVMFKTAKKIIWESEASDGTTNKVISWLEGRFKSILLQPNPIVAVDAEQLLKILPPNPKWSEEGERILKGIIGKIDHDQTYGVSKVEMLSFLKSIRPSWKPSEEQMKQLKYEIEAYYEGYPELRHQRSVLESLYNNLKKL